MYTLRLFGGVYLSGPPGALHGRIVQRRQLALLALLGGHRTRPLSRDKVVAYLWPASPPSAGRARLSDILHVLHTSLGHAAITGSREDLALNPDLVRCDVPDFRAALREREWQEALSLYEGPFLDGFHLDGSGEFEHWAEAERDRLRREAMGAATRLAQEQEDAGDVLGAATTARRALAIEPHDELAIRELEAVRVEARSPPGSVSPTRHREPPSPPRDGPSHGSGTPGRVGRRALQIVIDAVAVGALVGGVIGLVLRLLPAQVPLPRVTDPAKVTVALGVEAAPSWAPDGSALAYHSDQDGEWDIWVTQLGTGQSVNRTADIPANDLFPTWSPDGRWIAFFSRREGGGYFVIPAMGGTPRKVADWPPGEYYPGPAPWSPEGHELAYALGQRSVPRIEILTLSDRHSRTLALPAQPRNNVIADLSWSPDGSMLAYRRSLSPYAANAELWVTRVSGGESRQVTDGSSLDASPTWSRDSRALYFVSDRGGTRDLWRISLGESGWPEGTPAQVTAGMELTDAALGPGGERLAYTKGRLVRNVFRAPVLGDRPATWTDVIQLTFEDADFESLDVRADGQIVVSSDRSGNWDLFLLPRDGGPLRPLTADPGLDAGPRWSPDGMQLAFYSNRSGHRQVWVMPPDGGPPRQLTHEDSERWYPAWSPTGKQIAAEGEGIFVVTVQDGSARRVTDHHLDIHPDWSPDARWIAFASPRSGSMGIWRVPADGGDPERLTEVEGLAPRWSGSGDRIYFLGQGAAKDTVWIVFPDTRELRPAATLEGRPGELGRAGLAVDGQFLFFTWQQSRGDLWVADMIPPEGA